DQSLFVFIQEWTAIVQRICHPGSLGGGATGPTACGRVTPFQHMSRSEIALITMPYDQADIVEDFLDWHLDLGIDLILALDGGSTDRTRDVPTPGPSTKTVVYS